MPGWVATMISIALVCIAIAVAQRPSLEIRTQVTSRNESGYKAMRFALLDDVERHLQRVVRSLFPRRPWKDRKQPRPSAVREQPYGAEASRYRISCGVLLVASPADLATVRMDNLTGDVGRIIAEQEVDDSCDVFRGSQAAHRNLRRAQRFRLFPFVTAPPGS